MPLTNIAFDPIDITGITTAKLWLRSGSSSDPNDQKGAHQLLASLLTRGCGKYSHVDFSNKVENLGADLRCDTFEEGILISLKCAESNTQELLPLLGLMINRPHFDMDQLQLEKDLSLQAIKRQKENPFQIAFEGWRKIAYSKSSLAHDPLGEEKNIKKINQEDLLELSRRIKSQSQILVIGGSKEHKHLNKIKGIKTFIHTNEILNKENKVVNLKTTRQDNSISINYTETEQVVILLGVPTIPHYNSESLYLSLLSTYLGSGMTSVLFQRLREKHGVAYEAGCHFPARGFRAPFILHASTTEEKSLITLKLLLDTWEEVKRELIEESKLILTRAKFKGDLAHASQTIGQRAERIAQLISMNLSLNYDHMRINKIEAIKADEIRKAANTYLKNPILSVSGPESALKKISQYWESHIRSL